MQTYSKFDILTKPAIKYAADDFLYPFYKEKSIRLKKQMKEILISFDEETIHQLRVDIKKINAVFHLLELAFPRHFKAADCYKCIKPVFKKAGGVRQNQINLSLFKSYEQNPEIVLLYEKFLSEENYKMGKALKKKIKKLDAGTIKKLNKKIKDTCKKINEKILVTISHNFIKKESKTLKKLQYQASNVKAIHLIRIHLKLQLNILPILSEHFNKINLANLIRNLKYTESVIGNWHDHFLFSDSVRKFLIHKEVSLDAMDFQPLQKLVDMPVNETNSCSILPGKIELILEEMAKVHRFIIE